MATAGTVILTTALTFFLIAMFVWFAWVILGIRKFFYKIFKKNQINQVLNLLYENENNPMFKQERVEKYIKLGFYNPVIFEIAEKIYYKQNQGYRKPQLNKKEISYGHTKQPTKSFRQVERFEVPFEEPEPSSTEPEYTQVYQAPSPSSTRTSAGARIEPRGVPRAQPRTQYARSVEPRTNTGNSTRTSTDSQTSRQRDLQVRDVERQPKKSRYFG